MYVWLTEVLLVEAEAMVDRVAEIGREEGIEEFENSVRKFGKFGKFGKGFKNWR